jgi:hypothetical protein
MGKICLCCLCFLLFTDGAGGNPVVCPFVFFEQEETEETEEDGEDLSLLPLFPSVQIWCRGRTTGFSGASTSCVGESVVFGALEPFGAGVLELSTDGVVVMARANCSIVSGLIYHITHRCTNRSYLFKFAE